MRSNSRVLNYGGYILLLQKAYSLYRKSEFQRVFFLCAFNILCWAYYIKSIKFYLIRYKKKNRFLRTKKKETLEANLGKTVAEGKLNQIYVYIPKERKKEIASKYSFPVFSQLCARVVSDSV